MADGNGFTNKEILLRLEQKVDAVLADHEDRIRTVERWVWALPTSALAVVLAGVSFLR